MPGLCSLLDLALPLGEFDDALAIEDRPWNVLDVPEVVGAVGVLLANFRIFVDDGAGIVVSSIVHLKIWIGWLG